MGLRALPLLWLPGPCHYLLFSHVSKIVVRCVLPLLWIPGPRHYLLFSHVSKSWFARLPSWYFGSFRVFLFVMSSCHEILLYILVTTIKVVNCFSAYGLLQVYSF